MNIRKIILFLSLILTTMFCPAQNIVVEYELLPVKEATNYHNAKLEKALNLAKKELGKKTEEIIGFCPVELSNFIPQSPLSNFLTDALVELGNEYSHNNGLDSVDFAILNTGGIRTSLRAGNITIGNLYEISPFENYIVIVEIKGSEVSKIFKRFTSKKCEPTSKQVNISYLGDYVYKVQFDGQAIDPEKTYRMVTIDFIANGGDGILKDIEIGNVVHTGIMGRNGYINYIKKLNAKGQSITAEIDKRVNIIPQN